MLFYSTLSLAVHLVATITFTFHIREIHNESVVHVHVTSKITTATATQLCCQTFYCILKINRRKSPGDKLKSLDTRRKKAQAYYNYNSNFMFLLIYAEKSELH